MNFLYPGFLFAFAALSVPIIIHLFNFRKFKKVFFTNVRFLKEVKLDTQSRSRLKHLLVLACRILAISFLILAFARPFIPSATSSTGTLQKIVSIYIDNSFSMESVGKNGRLIDEALRKAHEITAAYSAGDHFQLLTNDFEVRHQRLVNRDEMESMIDEVKTGSSVRKTSEVVQRMKDIRQNAGEKNISHVICLLSDFQKTTADLGVLRY
ncbi:MAG: BatA domain-containing protein, partial [Bacteroidia bacterium]|nr:BatA domain-containing protein [Bacteroidia bacterium]